MLSLWIIPANLFCLLVASSGTGKTGCAKISTSKIYKIQNEEVKKEEEPAFKKQKLNCNVGEEKEEEKEVKRHKRRSCSKRK